MLSEAKGPNLRDPRLAAMCVSLGAAVVLFIGKMAAVWITGSAALLSDAAESVVHIASTALVFFSMWYALRPPDSNHPYGHGKIAYFSAGFEGALILCTSVVVMGVALRSLLDPQPVDNLGPGLAIAASLTVINLALGQFLVRKGRTLNSLILISNGKHVLTDMWTSVGVIAAVAVVWATGFLWLDGVIAAVVGLHILRTGVTLSRRAFHGLLDQADVVKTNRMLDCLHQAVHEGTLTGFHQLRHRQTDNIIWVDVHMLLPDDMTNLVAHDRVTRVEAALRELFPEFTVHVTSHVEPESHDEAHPEGHEALAAPFQGQEMDANDRARLDSSGK